MNITYAHVVDGAVQEIGDLPPTGYITNEDGEQVAVSNFETLDPEVLAENGWLQFFDDGGESYDPNTHRLSEPTYEIRSDHVVAIYSKSPIAPHVEVDKTVIEADDQDVATVTYYNANNGAPKSVVFTVNGLDTTVPVENARAELFVTTEFPGPIDIAIDVLPNNTITINATEVVSNA